MRLLNFHRNKDFSGGFTLIELLVVIAIIGILASAILVSLNSARLKARDARIQTVLFEIRNVAEMSYVASGNYEAVCDDGPLSGGGVGDDSLSDSGDFGKIENEIRANNGDKKVTCIESADNRSYAVSSPLVGRAEKHWCVSSVGIVKQIDNAITTSACP